VYRDEIGAPTIVASHLEDLVFGQGYEFARDRTWQLEQYHAIINGELAKLFGPDLLEVDEFIRTIGFKRAAEIASKKINPTILKLINSYLDGVNAYFDLHKNNLPLEYQLLNLKPTRWSVVDVVAMQGVMAYNFAFGGLSAELLRLKVIQQIGGEKSLELFPIEYLPARDYIANYNETTHQLGSHLESPLRKIFGQSTGFASNNWVIHGNKTESGNPLIANDPHLGLEVPGLWYQVNLQLTDNSYNVQGYTIPGVPLVLVGHNKYVAWAATSALIDALDLFYVVENGTHYFMDDEWKSFEILSETIEVKGASDESYQIKMTDIGPLMNTTDGWYVVKWTLLEGYERDQMFLAVYMLNNAETLSDIHDALYYWVTPGINFVFASVSGDIGYQYGGLLPIRKNGFGLLPQNGSDSKNGWNGTIDYEDQLFIVNPPEGYFATANERVDRRELFYINEGYAHDYRVNRIKEILSEGIDFEGSDGSDFSVEDIQVMQADTKNLAAIDLLEPVIDVISNIRSEGKYADIIKSVVNELINWDYHMVKDSIAATIFATYRLFLVQHVFEDELGEEITEDIMYSGIKPIAKFFIENKTNHWFDDQSTENIIESASDIIEKAIDKTVEHLINELGGNINNWKWGRVHKVSFNHVMGDILPFLNAGPEASDGSTFTINSYLPSPTWHEGEITYHSTYGPSFRLTAEVEATWSKVYSISAPGVSGHLLSKHYNDVFEDWLNFSYRRWLFSISDVEANHKFTTEFNH
jgi:penicillin amidase